MSLLRKVYPSIYFGNFEFNDDFSGYKQPVLCPMHILPIKRLNEKTIDRVFKRD